MKIKIKETDIGKAAIVDFEKNGFTSYQEVECDGRGIDLVLTKDDLIYSFELKTSLNLQVIHQSYINREFTNYSSIIVPSKKHDSLFYFCKDILTDLGIGLYVYKPYLLENNIIEIVKPYFNGNSLGLILYDSKKDLYKSGSQCGGRWTPFKETCEKLKEYVKMNSGCTISEVVKNITHHYTSKNSAISALKKRIEKGIIKDILLIDGKLYLNEKI
jgi:hypothetical protein